LPLIGVGFDRALLDAAQLGRVSGKIRVYQAALLDPGSAPAWWPTRRSGVSAAGRSRRCLPWRRRAVCAAGAQAEFNRRRCHRGLQSPGKDAEFTDASTADLANGASLNGIFAPFEGLASVLARYTFVLHSSPRPRCFWSG